MSIGIRDNLRPLFFCNQATQTLSLTPLRACSINKSHLMPQISPMDIVIIAILIFAVALILLGVDGVILLVESAQHRAKEV